MRFSSSLSSCQFGRLQRFQVVGIGRDIDHRRRAAYLGFAALAGHHDEEGLRRLVVEQRLVSAAPN